MRAPVLLHDPQTGRYFREPAGREAHGDWVHDLADATAYPTVAAAEARARRIHGHGRRWRWRWRLRVIPRPPLPTPKRQLVIPEFARRFL